MKSHLLLCPLLIAVIAVVSLGQDQSTSTVLSKTVTLKLENQEFSRFTNFLTRELEIPVGFEESLLDAGHRDYDFEPNVPFIREDTDSSGKKVLVTGLERVPAAKEHLITVDVTDMKLSKVLDIVVGQMQNYRWSIEDGLIRITPSKGRDPVIEAFLRIPLPRASIEKGVLICDLRLELPQFPPIAEFLSSRKLKTKTLFLAGYCYRPIGKDISVKNITFEELLNEIARKKGGGWAIRYKKLPESGYDSQTLDLVL